MIDFFYCNSCETLEAHELRRSQRGKYLNATCWWCGRKTKPYISLPNQVLPTTVTLEGGQNV